ncbi:MAG: glycosyltransferase [Jiangellaceae bacterium]|nr:glycosyltransferase [Jiangellaceae bacterium]
MRIALVSEHANPLAAVGGVDAGGQNIHVAALAAELSRLGHAVTVYTRRDAPNSPDQVTAPDGYVVEHVPAGPPTEVPKDELLPHMLAFSGYLADRWSREPPDVVHAHFWMSGLASLRAAARTGIPVVQTFHALGVVKRRHQGPRDTSPRSRIAVEEMLCRKVDHVIATCDEEVGELRAIGMPPGRASVIPCGVDLSLFRPAPPRGREDRRDEADARRGAQSYPTIFTAGQPRPNGTPRQLLVVGRLVERKGVADVVHALAEVPDAELLIAGGPAPDALDLDPEVTRLRAVADHAGVGERVHLLGRVEHADMPAVFHSCDVVVAVPWYEPFGIVPLEAMACARPIVGSAVGGLLDTVVPGVTGEVVPPRRPDVLADVLRGLLADPDRCARYGAAGSARARRLYSWQRVTAKTEQVYAQVTAHVGAGMEAR